MTTKEYLQQIDRLDRMINNKLQEIYQIRMSVCGTSSSNDGDRVQSSTDKDKLGVMVAKIVDMESEVNTMIDKRHDIVEQIERIDNTLYYDILFSKYVLKKSFEEISNDVSYSYRQTTREHGNALVCFEKMFGDSYLH